MNALSGETKHSGLAHPLRERLNWLKPPYRTFRRWVDDVYSRRNIHRGGPITRVNVGSGKDVRPEWWNIDILRFPGVQEVRDVTRPWRHRNLDFVFAEHFIEHLTLHQGLRFLMHAGDALRKGGVIRVSTPNLTHVILMNYRMESDTPLERRLDDSVAINGSFHGYGHQFLYSEEFLVFVLRNMGFEDVTAYDYGESNIDELRGMEHHGPFEIDDGVRSVATVEGSRGTAPLIPSPRLQALIDKYYEGDLYR